MRAIDTNVLVFAEIISSPQHARAREVLRSLAGLLARGEPPPVDLEDGARSVLIADACRRSARSGTPADVEPLAG